MARVCLNIPPKVHAELSRLAGGRSVEDWARDLLIEAAEEVRPALKSSGMWRQHLAAWRTSNSGGNQ